MLGDEGAGGGKVGRGSPRVLHNNTLAPWEYFRMCGPLKSEWECHHKSVTHPHTGVSKARENSSPTKWLVTRDKKEEGRKEKWKEGRKEGRNEEGRKEERKEAGRQA